MRCLNLFLVDADIVIHCHRLGIWPRLAAKTRIAVPAIVVSEARYFRSAKHDKQVIDLPKQVEGCLIQCLEASIEEFDAVTRDFADSFTAGIDDGEKEGLGLLLSGRFPDLRFCTGDTNAIEAAAMLAIDGSMISFETLIREVGLHKEVRIPLPSLTEKSFDHHVRIGKARRITREYFVGDL